MSEPGAAAVVVAGSGAAAVQERTSRPAGSWVCADPYCLKRNSNTQEVLTLFAILPVLITFSSWQACGKCGFSKKLSKEMTWKKGGSGGRGGGGRGGGGRGGAGGGRRGGGWGGRGGNWEKKPGPVVNTDDPVQVRFRFAGHTAGRNDLKRFKHGCIYYTKLQVVFGEMSQVLDRRHDKRERIVKLSRDITIGTAVILLCLI